MGAPLRNTTPERTEDEFTVTSGPRATRNLKVFMLERHELELCSQSRIHTECSGQQ